MPLKQLHDTEWDKNERTFSRVLPRTCSIAASNILRCISDKCTWQIVFDNCELEKKVKKYHIAIMLISTEKETSTIEVKYSAQTIFWERSSSSHEPVPILKHTAISMGVVVAQDNGRG